MAAQHYRYECSLQIKQMEPSNVNPWSVLIHSPFKLYNRPDEIEPFHEMIVSMIAPYYRVKSLTTILIALPLIIYVTLVVPYPPFLKIPHFASEPLMLRPENLQHYEFYRLFTSPFVYTELNMLAVVMVLNWCLGSFVEEFLGWRLLMAFCGFQGLLGYSYELTLPCFLIGCAFAYALINWADRQNNIIYRKITLVFYTAIGLLYFLFFIGTAQEQKYSSYLATVYGLLLTYMAGTVKDPIELPTYRKLCLLGSCIIFVALTSFFILNIVLYRITIV